MTSAKVWLAIAGVFIAMAIALNYQAQRIDAETARADLATDRQQTLEQRNERQAATIVRLGGEVAAQRADQQRLQDRLASLRLGYATDKITKQEIRRNDPHLSDWGTQPLPSAARRLHERPSFTGADDYSRWLSDRHSLHVEPSGADQ